VVPRAARWHSRSGTCGAEWARGGEGAPITAPARRAPGLLPSATARAQPRTSPSRVPAAALQRPGQRRGHACSQTPRAGPCTQRGIAQPRAGAAPPPSPRHAGSGHTQPRLHSRKLGIVLLTVRVPRNLQ